MQPHLLRHTGFNVNQAFPRPTLGQTGSGGTVAAQPYGWSFTGLPDTTYLYLNRPMPTGKWYWELKLVTTLYHLAGVTRTPTTARTNGGQPIPVNEGVYTNIGACWQEPAWNGAGAPSPIGASTINDVLGFAFDAGTLVLKIYLNGTLAATFPGATGTGGTGGSGSMYPMFACQSGPSGEIHVGPGWTKYPPPAGYSHLTA